jgi:hypothetical protein
MAAIFDGLNEADRNMVESTIRKLAVQQTG